MLTRRHLAAMGLAAVMGWALGCDHKTDQAHTPPPDKPPVVAPPATLPSVASDAAVKPDLLPTSSWLFFRKVEDPRVSQGEQFIAAPGDYDFTKQFPRACLSISGKGEDRVVVRLYSDDPKDALKRDWQGDRYYFHMPLQQRTELADLDDRPYRMSVPYDGADETSDGIFLSGDRYQLEPVDLSVLFENQGDQVQVSLGGLFKQVDTTDPRAEPIWYHVQAKLPAVVDKGGER